MKKSFKIILLVFLAAGVSLIGFGLWRNQDFNFKQFKKTTNGQLAIYFLDVGQGDAILLRTPQGADILIDGGPDNSVVYKLGKYLPFFDRQIELLILTHPHSDHVVGLNEVLKRYQAAEILTAAASSSAPEYWAWRNLIKEKKIKTEIINQQKDFLFDDGTVKLKVFPAPESEEAANNLNDVSLIAQLFYGETEAIFTGDLETEEELLKENIDWQSDVYKAGHHGSINANSLEFIKAVSPKIVVISCGQDNKFGHPHRAALNNFATIGAQVWRTDREGDVVVYSDGNKVEVKE